MNTLTFALIASVAALAVATPSGHIGGAVVSGPSGIVTDHGPIGPAGHGHGVVLGHGIGLGHGLGWAGHNAWAGHGWAGNGWAGHNAWAGHGAVIAAPVAHTVVSAPVAHAVVAAPIAHSVVAHAAPLALGHGIGHGVAVSHGAAAITNGGGAIAATAHGASVHGPPTAPAVIAGPAGKIVADGLWGPTDNIGHGAVVHGHGHGW